VFFTDELIKTEQTRRTRAHRVAAVSHSLRQLPPLWPAKRKKLKCRNLVKWRGISLLSTCQPLKDWKLQIGNISRSWPQAWEMVWPYGLLNGLKKSSPSAGRPGWNTQSTAAHTGVKQRL